MVLCFLLWFCENNINQPHDIKYCILYRNNTFFPKLPWTTFYDNFELATITVTPHRSPLILSESHLRRIYKIVGTHRIIHVTAKLSRLIILKIKKKLFLLIHLYHITIKCSNHRQSALSDRPELLVSIFDCIICHNMVRTRIVKLYYTNTPDAVMFCDILWNFFVCQIRHLLCVMYTQTHPKIRKPLWVC